MNPRTQKSMWVRLVAPVVGVAGLVLGALALGYTYVERQNLRDDLERRARVLAGALIPQAQLILAQRGDADPRAFADHFSGSERTLGVVLCRQDRSTAATSAAVVDLVRCDGPNVGVVLGGQPEQAWILDDAAAALHVLAIAVPGLKADSAGAVAVVHDASYIDRRVTSQLSWFAAALAFLGLLISVTTITSVRATFGRPLDKLADWMRHLRLGDGEDVEAPPGLPSESLALESERLSASLRAARTGAQALARQGAEADRLWTYDRLQARVLELLNGAQLVVVSNREPYMHRREPGQVRVLTPASGLVTALDPVLRACGGLWIAHGAGDADRETADGRGRLVVPPGEGRYTLRRVWLSREEEEGYYYGFSNEGLWPLCHATHEASDVPER